MSPPQPPDDGPAIGTFVYPDPRACLPDRQAPEECWDIMIGFALVATTAFCLGVLATYIFISL